MMYDDLSADYDRFVDWPTRLAAELPLIVGRVDNPSYILDATCGTGMRAIALAQKEYAVVGADLSAQVIERARANAAAADVAVRFEVAGGSESWRGCSTSPHPPTSFPSPARGGEGGKGVEDGAHPATPSSAWAIPCRIR